MVITDVKIRKVFDEEKLKAVVSVTFDHELCVHDIKIIQNQDNIFLAMPSKKVSTGEFKDIVHPINMDFRKTIEDCVLNEYKKVLKS